MMNKIKNPKCGDTLYVRDRRGIRKDKTLIEVTVTRISRNYFYVKSVVDGNISLKFRLCDWLEERQEFNNTIQLYRVYRTKKDLDDEIELYRIANYIADVLINKRKELSVNTLQEVKDIIDYV